MLQIQLLPFPVLSTERCILDEITQTDIHEFLQLNTDPVVLKYLDRGPLSGMEEATALINRIKDDEQHNRGIMWKITLKELGPKLIGMIGFWRLIPEHHRAELGFLLLPEYGKRGLVREALAKILEYGFDHLRLHSVEANVNPENISTRKTLESCGFMQEGYLRENYYYDGRFIDTVAFSIINNK